MGKKGTTYTNVSPGWVRRIVDRGVQQAMLILKATNLYATNIYDKTGALGPTFGNGLKTDSISEETSGNGILFAHRIRRPGVYAGIHVADGSTAQSIPTGASYEKITGFTEDGLSANCTADSANDKITVTKAGIYKANFSCSFSSGTNNVTWRCSVFLNGAEQHQSHTKRKTPTNDSGSMSGTGFIDVSTVPWDVDLRIKHDNGAAVDFVPEYMNLNVEYIGET